ncbi:hypothetical protein I350_08243 [Cryptococcus amylolentus CBS 6273]|uniref:RRM domain-containing protein n=1 Tax=Cryptococcus amylolentus CBS 6273 TaxID=1296118 RepID=A0A1E3J8J1_9TREE|nr:hypothetical protein I350_08243 [Cryptococcus amylolentus CBS 6273]
MAPKKNKFQKVALTDFFNDSSNTGGSWADDDMMDLPTAPAPKADNGPQRGEPGYLDSMPDRGAREFGGVPNFREELPLPTQPPYTAHIGNLSFEPDAEEQVKGFFADLMPVSIRIIKDPTGKPKGYGYVEFKTIEGLKNGLDRKGEMLQGREIRISVAEPPTNPRAPPSQAEEASQWRRSTPLPSREPSSAPGRRDGPTPGPSSDLDWSTARGSRFTPAPPSQFMDRESSGAGRPREMRENAGVSDSADKWRSSKPLADIKAAGRDAPPHQAGAPAGPTSPSAADTETTWSRGSKLKTPASTNPPTRQGSVDSSPRSPPPAPAAPAERRKLALKPRSATSPPASTDAPASSAGIFGNAKPVDSAAREKIAEDKLKAREEERKKAQEAEKAQSREAEERGKRYQEEKLRSIRQAQESVGGRPAAPAGKGPARKPTADKPRKDEQGFEQVSGKGKASDKADNKPKKDYSTRPAFSFAAAAGALKSETKDEESLSKDLEDVKI